MIIKVRVIPNSKRNDVVSRIGSILRVKIAAPAVEGKANEELCEYLSEKGVLLFDNIDLFFQVYSSNNNKQFKNEPEKLKESLLIYTNGPEKLFR